LVPKASSRSRAKGKCRTTARSMAHQPISGQSGSLQALRALNAARRIYTHVNNTNPILNEASPERAELTAAGWDVAFDGMKLRLE
jgi:pyrroloquinoline quinone biosynthesis protein B